MRLIMVSTVLQVKHKSKVKKIDEDYTEDTTSGKIPDQQVVLGDLHL